MTSQVYATLLGALHKRLRHCRIDGQLDAVIVDKYANNFKTRTI